MGVDSLVVELLEMEKNPEGSESFIRKKLRPCETHNFTSLVRKIKDVRSSFKLHIRKNNFRNNIISFI